MLASNATRIGHIQIYPLLGLSLIQKWNDLTQQEFCQGPDKIAMIFESTLVLT